MKISQEGHRTIAEMLELLDSQRKWSQNHVAENRKGQEVDPLSKQACKWSMYGAISYVQPDVTVRAEVAIALTELFKNFFRNRPPFYNECKTRIYGKSKWKSKGLTLLYTGCYYCRLQHKSLHEYNQLLGYRYIMDILESELY